MMYDFPDVLVGVLQFNIHVVLGYIQSMAQVNFHGVFQDAHIESDTGSEFVLAADYDLSFLGDVWYFPLVDIVNVYQQLNFTYVDAAHLLEGKFTQKFLFGFRRS